MIPHEETRLQWAIVDGELRNVSDFEKTAPKKRPTALCPVCLRQVTLKLGKVRVHHCAHQPGDKCAANQPETVLHLNTKFYIYHQLQEAQKIIIENRCEGVWHWGCQVTRSEVWLENWDNVEVEYTVSSFRPDISLLRKGAVIGAVEVLVTHAVDLAKERFFKQQNIPWLEVKAREAFYIGDAVWTAQQSLPFDQIKPSLVPWTCDECTERDRTEHEQIAYKRNNYVAIHAAQMVDIYYKSGKKYREVYYVMKQISNGECVEAWVKTEKEDIGPREKGSITKESLGNFSATVSLNNFRNKESVAIVDDFMGDWQSWEPGKKFVPRDVSRYPFRYIWDWSTGNWVKANDTMSRTW